MRTFGNYFVRSYGIFKPCKTPARPPDHVSMAKVWDEDKQAHIVTDKVSSRYWYGRNKRGPYIIRESDHWSGWNADKIVKCFWRLRGYDDLSNKQKTYPSPVMAGKVYMNMLH